MSVVDITAPTMPADNLVKPFRLETLELKGQLVRMGKVVEDILSRHAYPDPVSHLLAEALTLTSCLAGSLKYEGKFRLHTQSDGPVPMLVCDLTHEGNLRGYAQVNEEKFDSLTKDKNKRDFTLRELLGQGYLAFTVDSIKHQQNYQGIVDLFGETLTECVHHYFHQSAQIETIVKYAGGLIEGRYRSAALMLQRLPTEERQIIQKEELDENWRRAVLFLSSAKKEEMLSPTLSANDLIFRLFHEDGVRVYEPHILSDQCSCNTQGVERMIQGMDENSINEILKEGAFNVTCQFCKKLRSYDENAVRTLRQ